MTRDSHQMDYETVVCKGEKSCEWPPSAFERAKTSGRLGRRYGLRGLPGTCGFVRGFSRKSHAGWTRHAPEAGVSGGTNQPAAVPAGHPIST